MHEKIENLEDFLVVITELLKLIEKSAPVLFRVNFRTHYSHSLEEVLPALSRLKEHDYIQFPTDFATMVEAGLTGNQLDLKLESFEYSIIKFHEEGGLENLAYVLDKGRILLNSIAGAVPGFGSFVQELLEFILNELKQRKA